VVFRDEKSDKHEAVTMKDYVKSTELAFLPSGEINHYFQHNRYPKLPFSWILKPKSGQQGGKF
jgi:hypothetical protein